MRPKPIYVEIDIAADIDTVWELTQDPRQHTQWDARFSRIVPTGDLDGEAGVDAGAHGRSGTGYRFRYERRMPFHTITGTGTTIGERSRPDGTRTSALRFTTADRFSPLGDGRGYWRYVPIDGGTRFITGYDYEPGWGRALDAVLIRPLVGRLTAWSFDRLRIWAESGVPPRSPLRFWARDRPRASRCRRAPWRAHDATPPTTLDTLEAP